jgi:molybdate transport system substrate-binding protein
MVVLSGLALAGCGIAPAPAPRTLTVFAPASLTAGLEDLRPSFERQHPGVKVRFNFAGTQTLATQVEQGAPADVFVSADQPHVDQLLRAGRIKAPVVIARNRLVLIVPRANPAHLVSPFDLSRRGVKLDLAAPSVPAGNYARQALERLGGQPSAPAEFTRLALANVISQEENVEAVVQKVALGEVDAGIVYQSDLQTPNGKRTQAIALPDAVNIINVYPAAVVTGAREPALAQAFLDFLRSPDGQAGLQRFGFEAP